MHTGDFADLASLRGDSVDVAFAEGSLGGLADLGRVFRQVQRVLRAGAWFAFSLPHPFAFCVDADPEPEGSLPLARPYLARSYFDTEPATVRTPIGGRGVRGARPRRVPRRPHPRTRTSADGARAGTGSHRHHLAGTESRVLTLHAGHGDVASGRPSPQALVGVGVFDRTFVEPGLEQEVERLDR